MSVGHAFDRPSSRAYTHRTHSPDASKVDGMPSALQQTHACRHARKSPCGHRAMRQARSVDDLIRSCRPMVGRTTTLGPRSLSVSAGNVHTDCGTQSISNPASPNPAENASTGEKRTIRAQAFQVNGGSELSLTATKCNACTTVTAATSLIGSKALCGRIGRPIGAEIWGSASLRRIGYQEVKHRFRLTTPFRS